MSGEATATKNPAVPYRDAQIIARCGFGQEQQMEVAKDMGLHRNTVCRVMNSETARQLMVGALEQAGVTVAKLAKKHADLLDAKKEMNVDGELETVNDNVTQLGVLKELNSIYGTHAPKEFDIRGSTAQAPLDELADAAQASLEQLRLDGPAGEPATPAGIDNAE